MTRESKQAQALLRVFEALGVPLIGAVSELMAWQSPSGYADEDAAKSFAALLSSSIGTGTQLATRLAPATQEEAETVRLKTSTMAGAIIAQHYVLTGQFPDDAFKRRLESAFEGLLSLADSFALLPGEEEGETDMVAARVEALTPFVQAVMRFPFGMEDSAVIRKLGEKLCDKATALADAFPVDHPAGVLTFLPSANLRSLKVARNFWRAPAKLKWTVCNRPVTQGQLQQPPAPEAVVDQIWKRFEDGLDVLRAVIGFVSGPTATTSYSPQPKAAAQTPPPAAKTEAAKPQGNPANPMSFFVKKDDSKSGEAA